jgi:hypothetical protein
MNGPLNGQMSPWGIIQDSWELAPGIWFVSTPSHGGIRLSPERYAQMPDAMKATAFSHSGWYEEDADWAMVAVTFPEAFSVADLAAAKLTLANYLPEVLEATS